MYFENNFLLKLVFLMSCINCFDNSKVTTMVQQTCCRIHITTLLHCVCQCGINAMNRTEM